MTKVVERYFAAMRRGAEAEDDMMNLFAETAVYVEPFTDPETPAVGKDAIRARLRTGWDQPLPDMELDVLSIETDANGATSRWECRSPVLPGPIRGEDRYTIAGGLIVRLEVRIVG